jgi:hypothetical protein
MASIGFAMALDCAIDSLWEDLEENKTTDDEPSDDILETIAHMERNNQLLSDGNNHCDPLPPVLPLESYKKLAEFHWHSEHPGRDFYRYHGNAAHELMESERARVNIPAGDRYDDPNANHVVAIRESMIRLHRPLQNILIGYVIPYETLFQYISLLYKRSPRWTNWDQMYGFFEFEHNWEDVQFSMSFGGSIRYTRYGLYNSMPINRFTGTLKNAPVRINEYIKKVFDKCLAHLLSI